MSVTEKALKEVDAYPTSAVQNQFKGQSKYRSNFGGILSIVAIAALVGLTVPYVKSSFFPKKTVDEFGNVTMLAENPAADFGPGYYSDINLRFSENVNADLYETLPKTYLNAAQNGIKKMSIVLTDEAERTLLEKETALMKTVGVTNSSSLAEYIYSSRAEEIETAKSDWMKYI